MLKATVLAGIVTCAGTTLLQDAVANGDTRTLTLHHVHSGESATVTFKRNGRYDPAALKQLNVLLQDWRRKEPTNMDPQLFDIVWEVYREVDATQPIQVIGGYRSPETNSMLRARSRGVAQTSLHMQGRAMDFYIPGVPLAKIREAGLRLQRGGVGFYPTSGSPFVHLDTGGVRHWPRMTRPELARVFPSGKTVHIPADGKPMPGYALALAEVESRGSEPGGAGAAFAGLTGGNDPKKKKNFLAALFSKDDEEEADTAPATAPVPATARATTPLAAQAAPAPIAPLPAPVAVAAVAPVPLPVPAPAERAAAASTALPADTPFQIAAAPSVAVPLPASRPADAPKAGVATTSVALATAPMEVPLPLARPVEVKPAAVAAAPAAPPEIAVPAQGATLAFASATTPVFPTGALQPGPAPQALTTARAAAPAAPAAKTATPGATHVVASGPARAPAPHGLSPAEQEEARRIMTTPSSRVAMRTPELRRFAAFVAPAKMAAAGRFGADGSNGLSTSRFSGGTLVASAQAQPTRVGQGY